MNVALLMPLSRQLGGGEVMFKNLVCHSHDVNITWHAIFFSDGPLVHDVAREGVSTYVVQTGRLRQPIRFIRAVRAISKIVKEGDCQMVLSWSAKPHLYGSLAALLAQVPSAWYQLGSPDGTHLSFIDRLATLLPTRFIFVLSEMSQKAQNGLWPRRPTVLVYPGVDLERFERALLPDRGKARAKLGIDHDGPIIGIVGRLQSWKGIHVLVEAMPRVLGRVPNALCLIVGGGHEMEPDYENELRSTIDALELQEHVRLVGYQRNIPLWMQAMDTIVHASDHEPFGIVVVEAMALGKPVVASSSGGPNEIVMDGVNGLLSPFGDSVALADALLTFLENPQYAAKMGDLAAGRAKEFALPKFVTGVTETILLACKASHGRTLS